MDVRFGRGADIAVEIEGAAHHDDLLHHAAKSGSALSASARLVMRPDGDQRHLGPAAPRTVSMMNCQAGLASACASSDEGMSMSQDRFRHE
jgi:hypothetical protein